MARFLWPTVHIQIAKCTVVTKDTFKYMRSRVNLISSFIEVGLHSFYQLIQLSFVLSVITNHHTHVFAATAVTARPVQCAHTRPRKLTWDGLKYQPVGRLNWSFIVQNLKYSSTLNRLIKLEQIVRLPDRLHSVRVHPIIVRPKTRILANVNPTCTNSVMRARQGIFAKNGPSDTWLSWT